MADHHVSDKAMPELIDPLHPRHFSNTPTCVIPTTFLSAMDSEPVASACITALQRRDKHSSLIPGSGLKVLRLVSKQLRTLITRSHIQGYTLLIDGSAEDVPDVQLLKLTQLSRLCIKVVAGE